MSAAPIELSQRKGKGPLSPGLLKELRDCADDLERVLTLRVGAMDSASRIDTVIREQRAIVGAVAARLRALA